VGKRQATLCLVALVAVLAWVVGGTASGHWDYRFDWEHTSSIEPHKGAGCSFYAPIQGDSWFLCECYDPETIPDSKLIWVQVTAVALDGDWRSMVQNDALRSVGKALDLFASLKMVLVWVEVWDVFGRGSYAQPREPVSLMGQASDGNWSLYNWAEGFHFLNGVEGPLVAYWIGTPGTKSVTGAFDLSLYAFENHQPGMGIGATGHVIFTCAWVEDAE
jgi:hypothetical protein